MVKNKRHLAVSKELFNSITIECKEEYLAHHPEMEKVRITNEKILYEMAKYYLDGKCSL